MNNVKVLAINKGSVIVLIKFIILVSVALIAPLFHQQIITGSIVNATLFISAILLGPSAGILVGLIPSVIALSVGLLPPVLAPMIPFIMIGNTILVLTFSALKDKDYWLGVFISSVLKFVFLYGTSSIVINLLFKKEVASQVALMMNWPQLLTAVVGGISAYLFVKFYKCCFFKKMC